MWKQQFSVNLSHSLDKIRSFSLRIHNHFFCNHAFLYYKEFFLSHFISFFPSETAIQNSFYYGSSWLMPLHCKITLYLYIEQCKVHCSIYMPNAQGSRQLNALKNKLKYLVTKTKTFTMSSNKVHTFVNNKWYASSTTSCFKLYCFSQTSTKHSTTKRLQ